MPTDSKVDKTTQQIAIKMRGGHRDGTPQCVQHAIKYGTVPSKNTSPLSSGKKE